MVTINEIREAQQRIASHIVVTPFQHSRTLSDITGAQVWLKFENLQFTGSFKERGAANRLMTLDAQAARQGIIAVSAGNHAQGVAYHCQRLGIPATIVMPRFTPFIKIENTERFGARVVLQGDNFASARIAMAAIAEQDNLTIVPPFDDEMIIAGQGTIGLEMLTAQPDIDSLIIAIGGGGLISGVATAARALKPSIDIVGVQTEQYPGAYQLWTQQHASKHPTTPAVVTPATVPRPVNQTNPINQSPSSFVGGQTLAEGIAVQSPGEITGPLITTLVDHMTLVDEASIESAVLLLLEIEKTVVEGAGAVGLAALLKEPDRFRGKKVGLILCGGNIDMLTLSNVARHQLARADRLVRMSVDAPDSPGTLANVARIIGEQGANIEDVSHQRAFASLPVRYVRIDLTLSTRGTAHLQRVLAALTEAGYHAAAIGNAPSDSA
ncbi:MAG: pyridoxal-phosphate dependent enzyme [Burkholderiaceae bacterium]